VNWASVTGNENYIARSLLCGDKAILVIVFDCRYFGEQKDDRLYTPAFAKMVNPVKVKVTIPSEIQVCKAESSYRPLSNKLWNYQNNQLNFTANMVSSVQIYKLTFALENKR
ncbi:MAG: hypothetical protein ACYS9Y_12525, partial [Planctomycetota bacterium]